MKAYRTDHQHIVTRLTKANIIEKHAEAIASELLGTHLSKEYLELKFREMTAITEARIEYIRADLLKWFIGTILVQTIALIITIALAN